MAEQCKQLQAAVDLQKQESEERQLQLQEWLQNYKMELRNEVSYIQGVLKFVLNILVCQKGKIWGVR